MLLAGADGSVVATAHSLATCGASSASEAYSLELDRSSDKWSSASEGSSQPGITSLSLLSLSSETSSSSSKIRHSTSAVESAELLQAIIASN